MSTDLLRAALIRTFPGTTWTNKVAHMTDSQVKEIHTHLKERNLLTAQELFSEVARLTDLYLCKEQIFTLLCAIEIDPEKLIDAIIQEVRL